MKKQNGVTLVALAITVIVLMILAGVTIATLTSDRNIVDEGKEAVTKYNAETVNETRLLNAIEILIQQNK